MKPYSRHSGPAGPCRIDVDGQDAIERVGHLESVNLPLDRDSVPPGLDQVVARIENRIQLILERDEGTRQGDDGEQRRRKQPGEKVPPPETRVESAAAQAPLVGRRGVLCHRRGLSRGFGSPVPTCPRGG